MVDTDEIKAIYKEIQKKLYYMIPEKWTKLYLYASITEKAYAVPVGEMYFYYFPKGILKKNPVNVYEIPTKFNLDENQYLRLVKNLYSSIVKLRKIYKREKQKLWTNITISIENFKFNIEYNYEALDNREESNYERHILWRYERLGLDINSFSKKDKKIIEKHLVENNFNTEKVEKYSEPLYQKPVKNSFDYQKPIFESIQNADIMHDLESEEYNISNQILANIKKQ